MLRVKTYVAASQIHGLGLFAGELIPKGTLIWQYDLGLDVIVDVREIPLKVMKQCITHFGYQTAIEEPIFIVCLDNARYMNNSETPNTRETKNKTIAIRDIREGEEITSRYRELDKRYVKRDTF